MENRSAAERRSAIVIGSLLVVAGVGFLVGQQLGVNWAAAGWPLFVIVPGIVLFAIALATGGRAGAGIAVPAGIVTLTGVVLAVQNATGLYATWAYAWALVAPGGVGLGLFLFGLLTRQPEFTDAGARTLLVGLGLFLGFGFFFEAVIGLSGARLAGMGEVFAAGLVVVGIVVVILSVVRGRRDEPPSPGAPPH